jgi:SEC-C motif-containing protein
MRARYTAFARGQVDFILATHHSRTRHRVKRREVQDWAQGSEWLGLEILEAAEGGAGDTKGTVSFHATYRAEGKQSEHYEKSTFEREGGGWRFVDGQPLTHPPVRREAPKVGRNEPCPCGSGKKYKKCCGAAA